MLTEAMQSIHPSLKGF